MTVIGMAGSIVTALSCFTPLLTVLLAALGLAAGAWLDLLLLPALGFFLLLTGLGLWKRRQTRSS